LLSNGGVEGCRTCLGKEFKSTGPWWVKDLSVTLRHEMQDEVQDAKPIRVMKLENKRDPKTDPCGTPVLRVIVLDLLAPIDT